MLAELTRVEAAWPLAASLVLAVAARGLEAGRRRSLNEALHELRRPLQALVLIDPPEIGRAPAADLPLRATRALERLDREINGGPRRERREPVPAAELVEAAVWRWRRRAELAGVALGVGPAPAAAILDADREALVAALDNLVANAIEHGGSPVLVGAELGPGRVRLTVADSGTEAPIGDRHRVRMRPGRLAVDLTALARRRRHGHGLRLVRRVAAAHGGRFRLQCGGRGAVAVLDLPLPGGNGIA